MVNPSGASKTYSSGIPANLSAAGLTQNSGQPLSPSDVNAYLTQLGGSLNGFTNQVTTALNYLLASGDFSVKQVAVGYQPQTFNPVLTTGTQQGTWMGMATNGVGSVITPQVTGRILVLAFVTYNAGGPVVTTQMNVFFSVYWSLGTNGPTFGAVTPVARNANSGIFDLGGSSIQFKQGATGGTNFQTQSFSLTTFDVVPSHIAGTPIGQIVLNQPVWVDLAAQYQTSDNANPVPSIIGPSYVILVEY